jgi:hypothetical protein
MIKLWKVDFSKMYLNEFKDLNILKVEDYIS